VNYLSNPMPTNSDGQLAPKDVVERDRTLIAIATITRNVGIVIVILALISSIIELNLRMNHKSVGVPLVGTLTI
jgi:hypothetical protein